jgi:hypothetical protein
MVMEDGRPARRFSRIAHSGTHIFATSTESVARQTVAGWCTFGGVLGQISRIAFVLHSRIHLEQHDVGPRLLLKFDSRLARTPILHY